MSYSVYLLGCSSKTSGLIEFVPPEPLARPSIQVLENCREIKEQ